MEGHNFPAQTHKTSMRMSTAAVVPGCSLLLLKDDLSHTVLIHSNVYKRLY